MHQYLPDNAMELVADSSEKIVYVLCLNHMKDFLSGDEKSGAFCMITSERVYWYKGDSDGVKSHSCDLDDVKSIDTSVRRHLTKFLNLLYVIPCVGIYFGLKAAAGVAWRAGVAGAIPVVFWMIIAYAALAGAVACVILSFVKYKRSATAVMHINDASGVCVKIDLPSMATAEIATFESELKRARAARRAVNKESFLY